MFNELMKIYYHGVYALRSSIFRRSQRRLRRGNIWKDI